MKFTYIYHSGYVIETDDIAIIVDYFEDSENNHAGIVHNEILQSEKSIYVLSTHSHHDHFNPEILKWREKKRDIKYIFSKDILDNRMAEANTATYLDKMDTYKDDVLKIQAFGSTDLGISFLIELDGKTFFHAGDLNNWHWNEESTKEEIIEAEAFYEQELNLLAENVKHIHLAMFPIDPRLGKDYMIGAEQFINKIKTDILAPMHFDEAYNKAAAFTEIANANRCKFIAWKERGESIEF